MIQIPDILAPRDFTEFLHKLAKGIGLTRFYCVKFLSVIQDKY